MKDCLKVYFFGLKQLINGLLNISIIFFCNAISGSGIFATAVTASSPASPSSTFICNARRSCKYFIMRSYCDTPLPAIVESTFPKGTPAFGNKTSTFKCKSFKRFSTISAYWVFLVSIASISQSLKFSVGLGNGGSAPLLGVAPLRTVIILPLNNLLFKDDDAFLASSAHFICTKPTFCRINEPKTFPYGKKILSSSSFVHGAGSFSTSEASMILRLEAAVAAFKFLQLAINAWKFPYDEN
uniref:Uncharacterized protein n=1 Tax=Glossina pallidipes TaxID=7398 RepID=A0A1A9ZJ95_GLOPL